MMIAPANLRAMILPTMITPTRRKWFFVTTKMIEGEGVHRFNENEGPLSQRVVMAVADAEGVEPWDLEPPLYEVVDADALDVIFQPTGTRENDPQRSLTFSYHGYTVAITNGEVTLTER